MEIILDTIFKNNAFNKFDVNWDNFYTVTYINEKSDTYIIVFIDDLSVNLHDELVSFSLNVFNTKNVLSKANKSNLYIVIVLKVNDRLKESDLNIIFMIEENNLYYKKYLLWYTEEELLSLKQLLKSNYSSNNMDKILVDYKQFDKFKKSNLGYALLSRLYIKLAFLTLAEIKTLNKTLVEYIESSVNKLSEGLFDEVINNSTIDKSIKLIELNKNDMKYINKLMEEVKL